MKSSSILLSVLFCLLRAGFVHSQTLDFGDAPDSYGITLNKNGACHDVNGGGANPVYLGGQFGTTGFDAEVDGQPSEMANGDDINSPYCCAPYNNDETGNTDFRAVPLSKSSYYAVVSVRNLSVPDATVSAWIDFDKNGVFDANERAQAVVPQTPSPIHYNGTLVTLTWNGLTEGWTYARVRVAFDAADVENPTGLAHSGEVEDYRM